MITEPTDTVAAGTFTHRITPRFHEIDSEGVVFNMWYLGYVDEAVRAFFDHCGVPRPRWRPDLGVDVRVAHAELDWRAPVLPGDTPEVTVRPARIGTRSFTLDVTFRSEGTTTCAVSIVYVVVAADGSGTTAIPAAVRGALVRDSGRDSDQNHARVRSTRA